jgi:hypothetical protein|nr:MAG TPA: hypothetical protein [Bacteriophage sp.]
MSSGGWLGSILSLPMKIISSITGAGSHTYSASDNYSPTVKASDLVSSTTAQTPDAPVMGDDTTYSQKKRNKRGLSSLYVNSGTGSTGDYTGRSGL